MSFYYNNYIYSYNFSPKKKFNLFISLEWKYNKLQFGIRISSIEARKQKIHISTALYVNNKTYNKEIHPGATPFSRVKGFSVSVSFGFCLVFLSRTASRKCRDGLEETLLDGVLYESAIVEFFHLCFSDHQTGSNVFVVYF